MRFPRATRPDEFGDLLSTAGQGGRDPQAAQPAGSVSLGVPTIADRVAQTVVAMYLEPLVEPRFHQDSYGYRPGRSAHDALAVCRERCWKFDWAIDLDVQKFFDEVPWDLVVQCGRGGHRLPLGAAVCQAVAAAPLQRPDGTIEKRTRGTPQGGLCSAEHNPPYAQYRVMRSES